MNKGNIQDRLCCLEKRVELLQTFLAAQNAIVYVFEDYQVTAGDSTIVTNSLEGPFTVTLPDAKANEGKRFTFKRVPGGGDVVTIEPSGTDTIDGNGAVQMINDWASYTYRASDGVWLTTATFNSGA